MAEGKLTRDDVLTASIVANAMGKGKYKSRQAQLKENIKAKNGENIRFDQNLAMKLGDFLEEGIINFACSQIGLTNVVTEFGKKFEHPFYPVECSLDGMADAKELTIVPDEAVGIHCPEADEVFINNTGIIECKLTKDFPDHSQETLDWRGWLQLKTQVECANTNWGVLVIFYQSSYELHYYFYQRDMEFGNELKELAEEWQERIKTESYFDPETSDDAWLKYDEAIPEEVAELNPEAIDILAQIENLDENIKLMGKQKDQLQAQIMDMMGNAEQAVVGDYHVNWGMINYKAQPEKVVPAKEAYSVRRKSIRIKQVS